MYEYAKVYRDLKARIQAGEFAVGDALPSIPELQRHYDAALSTVRSAQQLLEEDGLVRRVQGKGVYVMSVLAARDVDVSATLDEAIALLSRSRAALAVQGMRSVTFNLDDPGVYETLTAALSTLESEYTEQARDGWNSEEALVNAGQARALLAQVQEA